MTLSKEIEMNAWRIVRCLLAVMLTMMLALPATAEETLKLAVGQRGNWDTSVPELGQRAGIFKKWGLALELLYTQGSGETQQAVISGSVDIGIAAGAAGVIGAYAKGAPVRVIGAETTGAADYWYVPATSPIKTACTQVLRSCPCRGATRLRMARKVSITDRAPAGSLIRLVQ